MTNHASRPPKKRLGKKILNMLIFRIIIISPVSAPNTFLTAISFVLASLPWLATPINPKLERTMLKIVKNRIAGGL